MRAVCDWEEKDLDDLYVGEIMESTTLEYKDSRALGNTDHQKTEMFKDVSAFANSGGGILIYGMKERGHLPIGTDEGVSPRTITREWIENLLTTNIQPQIEGLVIKPVILSSKGTGNVAYVLEIPAAKSRSPHQGPEHRYYKRFNFKAEPMEDYEVRDLMRRGLEYGRKYGAALDLFIEISRICSICNARSNGSPGAVYEVDRFIISVSVDLRSAGNALVLLSRHMRNAVAEFIIKIDAYNSNIEARGGTKVMLDQSARDEQMSIKDLGDQICRDLKTILDQEP
ncbi:ATP-binding protein [Bradyrhizobium sp. 83002]|uniref:AlbA family DNA-binding domain-containing protein n=1 Tax=Bradyrhizobium aeschynomenes TaxID=2734909 RepID=UPI001553CBC8|nr:ATP-binding protein [Bradyrhizobium aeschynomenes]NPU11975.1 ATP-binding protein [Bradyrhizobium aeschynomenes]